MQALSCSRLWVKLFSSISKPFGSGIRAVWLREKILATVRRIPAWFVCMKKRWNLKQFFYKSKCSHWKPSVVPCRRTVNMIYKRVCRDCLIPGCGAKYLVRLDNHLADVHQLDHTQWRKYLQEAKLQPKVKVVIYDTEKSKRSGVCSSW